MLCGESKGMLHCALLLLQKFSMNTHKKAMDFSYQQLLNGQRVLRMLGFFFNLVLLGGLFFCSFNIGSLNGKSMELCEELLRREVGICCIQKVRWRGMGLKFLSSLDRRFKMWWSDNEDKIGGVGILVRGE